MGLKTFVCFRFDRGRQFWKPCITFIQYCYSYFMFYHEILMKYNTFVDAVQLVRNPFRLRRHHWEICLFHRFAHERHRSCSFTTACLLGSHLLSFKPETQDRLSLSSLCCSNLEPQWVMVFLLTLAVERTTRTQPFFTPTYLIFKLWLSLWYYHYYRYYDMNNTVKSFHSLVKILNVWRFPSIVTVPLVYLLPCKVWLNK